MLYAIYGVMTLVLLGLLLLSGLPLFDAAIHAMGTAGTGGFSNRNLPVRWGSNNLPAEIMIIAFMFLFHQLQHLFPPSRGGAESPAP